MIQAKNITKTFGNLQVLRGIDLEIRKSEIVSIVGASGAGKTTLLQILGTLHKQDTGEVVINGVEIKSLSEKQLSRFRNQNIGFVFQFHHLLPEFTALENVCIPAYVMRKSKKEAESAACDILNYLGLDQRLHHKPAELSGGEKQRVAIARALINSPSVVLADEPSGNLDSKNTQELYQLFLALREKYKQTFVIVTHNLEIASISDRTLLMKDGTIITS